MLFNWLTKVASVTSASLNVILFNGHQDETLSARAWRENRPIYKVINKIFFWEDNHCRNAHLTDIQRAEELLQLNKIRI